MPGLLSVILTGNINTTNENPGNWGVDPLGPSHSESKASPPWANNRTIVYSGQIYDEDGKISFMEDIDDGGWLSFANETCLNNTVWNERQKVASNLEMVVGSTSKFAISNGGGGAGRADGIGFGWDPEGGTDW